MSERIDRVTKLNAARRQLNVAIRLFFEKGDMVAVHTLAAAAHDILLPIVKKHDHQAARESCLNPEDPRIVPARRKEWADIIRATQNFFKHGSRDPEQTFEFRLDTTAFYIMDCITLLDALGKQAMDPELIFFEMWFFLKYPDVMNAGLLKDFLIGGRKMNPDNLEAFRGAIDVARARAS